MVTAYNDFKTSKIGYATVLLKKAVCHEKGLESVCMVRFPTNMEKLQLMDFKR